MAGEKIQVPPISKFLEHPGEPLTPIDNWTCIFDQYITVTNINRTAALTSPEKNALLFRYLGWEGCRIMQANTMYANTATASHGNFMDAVKKQFTTEKSKVRAQVEFA
ncbi:MAG: hypothetical protein GY696_34625, partial [Gammaproteobacteria bacterium]|nr:hypothetical protein [Gammaproteobacteria bacterium]